VPLAERDVGPRALGDVVHRCGIDQTVHGGDPLVDPGILGVDVGDSLWTWS
jgi:hypothetical protein